MSERTIVAPRVPLLSSRFTALLVANLCFGYAFSCFFLLPKFMNSVLGAGPAAVGWVTLVHGATIVVVLPLLGAAVDRHGRCRSSPPRVYRCLCSFPLPGCQWKGLPRYSRRYRGSPR